MLRCVLGAPPDGACAPNLCVLDLEHVQLLSLAFAGDVQPSGVDVSPHRFVERLGKIKLNRVCLSSLLTVTLPKVKETIDALKQAGTRVKVLVGGRSLNRDIAIEMGAR